MSILQDDPSEIGQQYFYGEGRRKNYKKAFPYLVVAGKMGDPHCQNLVGYCYDLGLGTEKDPGKAFYWYNLAARNNDIDGLFNLALYYDSNNESKRAFSLYIKAAKLGAPGSQCNLALAYLEGSGTKLNRTEGLKWMRRAALQGDSKAQYNLGRMYLYGESVRKNVKHAKTWLSKAAKNRNGRAIKLLAKVSDER